jgi:TonB family protein
MSVSAATFQPKDSLAEEAACLLAGAAVTLGLFLGLAHFQHASPRPPAEEIADLRAVSLPPELPPPPPSTITAGNEAAEPMPLSAGLEASPSESPVHIAVSPLAFDLPSTPATVPPEMSVTRVYPEFKPGAEVGVSEKHIYMEAEVDQLPRGITRSLQFVPHALRLNLTQIRVVLVMLLEKNGTASSVRIVKSSGNAALDEIAARSVREDWVFSPAIKRGKPVRCYVQQTVIWKFTTGSVLEAGN